AEVYIHGLIRDQDGQKMSKSKGNVLDPLDLVDGIDLESLVEKRTTGMMQPHLAKRIEKSTRQHFPEGIPAFGTDAIRFTFAAIATTGRDLRFDLGRAEGYRNFCNKLWNASRYVLMNTEEQDCGLDPGQGEMSFSLADQWIRSRLGKTIEGVLADFENYRLDLVAKTLYEFTWNEFCDWYLELSKPILQSEESSEAEKRGTRRTLVEVLECLLRLLHPIMPFITEEIWQRVAPLAGVKGPTIMLQPYPDRDAYPVDAQSEKELNWVRGFVLGIRQIRGEMNISPGRALPVVLQEVSATDSEWLGKHKPLLERLARLESVTVPGDDVSPPPAATALLGEMRILVPMAGLIDVAAEIARLTRQRDKLKSELDRCTKKLANENFVNNAPEAVVEKERARIEEFTKSMRQLDEQLQVMEALES
ncbi:MAG: class I tRNA ligase family protein, partial [Gammaproteobacteria bacterium]